MSHGSKNNKHKEVTHLSFAAGGIFAFPLNWRVISLIAVGSERYRTTFPLMRAGLTSTPVPRRTRVSEATTMSTAGGPLSTFSLAMSCESREVWGVFWVWG